MSNTAQTHLWQLRTIKSSLSKFYFAVRSSISSLTLTRAVSAGSAQPVEFLENRQMLSGTWTALTNAAPGGIHSMFVMGNGTVMCQLGGGTGWASLTPNASGSYQAGTWTLLSDMHDTRTYYSSQVLTDGRVFIAGGEYGSGGSTAEVYNPLTNTWTSTPASGMGSFLDSISEILPNGNVLVAPVYPSTSGGTGIYNPATNTWSAGPTLYRGSDADEQGWVKLPDNSILSVDGSFTSERYIPATNSFVNDAAVPVKMYDGLGEIGAGLLLASGKAFFIGSTGNTAIYTPSGTASPGSWAAGPTLPGGLGEDDAPAALLPDGTVLLTGGPIASYSGPTTFFIYDPSTNAMSAVAGAPSVSAPPYGTRFLDLPDGTVLFNDGGSTLYDYNPGTTALTAPKPTITSIAHNADGSYLLTGTQLNGNSEGAFYGDDAQMNSNYPVVRLTSSGGTVYFARTYNWSSTAVQTGTTPVTTTFTLPLGLPAGTYTVAVMVNGFVSTGVSLTTPYTAGDAAPTVATAAAASPGAVTGVSTTLSVLGADTDGGGESNLTYTWVNTSAPSGQSTASVSINGTNAAKSTTATFQQAGSYTFKVYITDSSGLSTTSTVTVVVSQTLSSIAVTPAPVNLTAGQTQQLTATGYDQFGNIMAAQPTFTWALTSGGGTVTTTGLYTTPATGTLAVVTASTGTFSASDNIYVLSSPWISADIGSPGVAGSAFDSGGTFNVSGSGLDVWGTADHFQYVYRPLGGDGMITARVVGEPNPITGWEKAGVMIRGGLDQSAQQAFMAITPGNGAAFQYRNTSGGSSANVNTLGKTAPYWVRLVRSGSTIAGYYSANGTTWTKESQTTISMTGQVYVGLFITSQSDTAASTVTIDNVSLLDAAPDSMTVNAGVASSINVLTNDVGPAGSTLTVTGVTQGSKGTVTFNASGGVTYTAGANYTGPDTFSYTVSDGLGDTATASVSVSILGLQAYYRMNEGTGTSTADATGDGFNGTLTSTTWTSGVDGSNGLNFNGSGSVSVPALNLNSNTVTLSAWIKPSGAQSNSAALIFSRDSSGGYGLDFNTTTTLGYTWGNSATPYSFNTNLAPAVGAWTFVALVITPTNATFYMQPLGGSMSTKVQTFSEVVAPFSSTTAIGMDPTYTTRNFKGAMDEVRIYNQSLSATAIASLANLSPTFANAAAANPSPVTTTATSLSVLGADYAGESALTYTWAATTLPSGATAPIFSANGTNAAKSTTATFSKAGNYVFTVTLASPGGLTATSTVNVTVNQTLTALVVSPASASITAGASQQFTAVGNDQFGAAMAVQPTITWTKTGAGTLTASGLYTASVTGGSATVTATSGSVNKSVTVNSTNAAPTVATAASASPASINATTTGLSVLGVDDAGEANLTYAWAAVGSPPAAVTFSANNSNAAKTTVVTFSKAGTYTLQATITDSGGLSVTSTVIVVVNQTLTGLSLGSAYIVAGGSSQATAIDQFGNPFVTQPGWTTSAGGSITPSGAFTANASGQSFTVTATVGTTSINASVTVVPIIYSDGAGADKYALRLSPTDPTVEQIFVNVPESATPTYQVPIAQLPALTFTPAADGRLTVDYTNGNPLPVAGLSYSGGASLFITGVSGGGLGLNMGSSQITSSLAANSPINYSNIQTIEFDLKGGANTLTQTAQPTAAVIYNSGAGSNTLNVSGGAFTFSSDPQAGGGNLTVNDGAAVMFTAAGTGSGYSPRNLHALNLIGTATATLATGTNTVDRLVLQTDQLSLSADSILDLTNNAVVVHGGNAAAISNLIKNGMNAGGAYWTGNGIISSTARNDSTFLTSVGVLSNDNGAAGYVSTFDNQPVGPADVILRYTYYGDVNLDGKVDGSDYSRIDSATVTHASGYFNGDVNYDGVVNGSDYTLMDNTFNVQGAVLPKKPAKTSSLFATPLAALGTVANYNPSSRTSAGLFSNAPIASTAEDILDSPSLKQGGWRDDALSDSASRLLDVIQS